MSLPPLPELLRHLAQMPAAFRGDADVPAVVSDLVESVCGHAPPAAALAALALSAPTAAEDNRRRWVLATCHLLWHAGFRDGAVSWARLEHFLVLDLATLAGVVAADSLDKDDERREELVRRLLRALELPVPGESSNESADRFRQVDSLERRTLLAAAAARERRAREVREAMAKKAAQEAAAKVSRE